MAEGTSIGRNFILFLTYLTVLLLMLLELVHNEKFQSQAKSSRLCSLAIVLEDTASGRSWSCDTPSLARDS